MVKPPKKLKPFFDLNRELGTTLILVTHDRNLAALCQRHVELDDGRLKTVQGG